MVDVAKPTATQRGLTQRFLRWLTGSLMAVALVSSPAWAKEAELLAVNPEQEARMMAIAAELRCLVCQNQTVADSHAGLAVDLRQQIRELLAKGQTDQEVRDYMTQRYGAFILYRPPVEGSTALLWFGPGLLAVGGLLGLWLMLRRRARMQPDAFDPDEPEADTDHPVRPL